MRFFESGHGPPLLRYFEQLFLDVGVGHLSSVLFAFARLGPILFCRARHCRHPVRSLDDERTRRGVVPPNLRRPN